MLIHSRIFRTFCLLALFLMTHYSVPSVVAASEWDLEPPSSLLNNEDEAMVKEDGDAGTMIEYGIPGSHPTESVHFERMKKEAADLVGGARIPMSPDAVEAYRKYREKEKLTESVARSFDQIQGDFFKQGNEQGFTRDTLTSFVEANKEEGEYAQKHILVFISSSMPEGSLRNYLTILGKSGHVAFILRGLVDNDITKIAATREWTQNLLCHGEDGNEECYKSPIDINPVLFERMKVDRVPAVAYIPSPDSTIPDCDEEISESDYLMHYGDFNPIYILETFIKSRPEDERLRQLYTEITGKRFFRENDESLVR